MKRLFATCLGLPLLVAACATSQPWTPTVDNFGSSQSQYVHRDMHECRELAFQVSGHTPNQAVRGAATGGLVGAVAGTAIGAAVGHTGRGAAIGATAGAVGAGATRARSTEQAFQQAYVNCMRQRGHRVVN
jgi:outer membrane lipoprotein SlyB